MYMNHCIKKENKKCLASVYTIEYSYIQIWLQKDRVNPKFELSQNNNKN